jgi:hypothetical protein
MGADILGRHVTIENANDGVRCIPDFHVQLPDGEYTFAEVKTNGGTLTTNQRHNYSALSRGEVVVPRGANAAQARLPVGQAYSARVLIIRVVGG